MPRPRPILITLLAAAVLLGALSPRALADGKVFARYSAIPQIPDQEALIHYADGVQTLVIDTRFTLAAPFLVAAATYAAYPRIPAGAEYSRQAPVRLLHRDLSAGLMAECAKLQTRSGPDAITLDALRQMHDRLLEPYRAGDRGERLQPLAQRTREEDSPGNFILREDPDAPGTFEYLWMDESGRTWREWIWSTR